MISHGGICRITLNKIKILRHEITMIVAYVVEYEFSNCFGDVRKRKRFPGDIRGFGEAKKKFEKGVQFIKWNQSEDYESVSLYADTNTDGLVLYRSWDTEYGFRFGNAMEAYADG